MIDLFGHAMYAVLMTGTWLGAKGCAVGWLLRMLGDLGWMWIGYKMKMTSIIIWSAVFFLVDTFAFLSN